MSFSQIMDFASQYLFKVCVARYNGNYKDKDFPAGNNFFALPINNYHIAKVRVILCYV